MQIKDVSCKASGLLHNETARAKPGDVQSFCCDAYIAYLQHTVNTNKKCVNKALIKRQKN